MSFMISTPERDAMLGCNLRVDMAEENIHHTQRLII